MNSVQIAENGRPSLPALASPALGAVWIKRGLTWLVLPVTFGLAITRQSLWMDEGFTVWFASHKSMTDFFSALLGSPGSTGDPQLLFYMLYMWGWVKIFGQSEVALRATNIPFALLLLGTLGWAAQRFLRLSHLWVLFCLSPFLWFYLNDARPYVALMALSAVAIVALLAYLVYATEYSATAPWVCLGALLLAWGTHILGAFLFPSMIVLTLAALVSDPSLRRGFLRAWSRPFLCFLPAFVALGTFYAWASAHGVSKEKGAPGLANLAFAFYEFMGFAGLGPPRLELRENAHLNAFAPYWPLLLIGTLPLLGLAFLLLRARPSKLVWHLMISLCVGVVLALGLSSIEQFQLLGRHMAVFFPLLLITLMLWASQLVSSRSQQPAAIAVLIALAVAWCVSDVRLVYMSKYQKDAYREASAIAEARARQDAAKILWVADPRAAGYYGIRVTTEGQPPEIAKENKVGWRVTTEALDAHNWRPERAASYVQSAATPLLLVLSRPDLFDTKGAWRTVIAEQKPTAVATLPAFSIYEWNAPGASATLRSAVPSAVRETR